MLYVSDLGGAKAGEDVFSALPERQNGRELKAPPQSPAERRLAAIHRHF